MVIMREIKFRGISKNNNRWIYGFVSIDKNSAKMEGFPHFISRASGYLPVEVVPRSVGQYTGLKDKNGVDIYDGDYIRYSMRTINGSIYTHVCRVFQHESGTWRIEGYHEDNHSYETKGTVYAAHLICEVIGNIYENPELAK